jgi:energy-coupling factor transport system ATP-binding protein
MNGAAISVDDLRFAYKHQVPLFESVRTHLPFSKVVAITGANGVGKTTFARLLTGLVKMQAGTITMDGKVVRPPELLKRSSIILQNTDHQLHMQTVRAELELSAGKLSKSGRQQKIHDVLELFHLKELAGRHPQSLSGGQKQRLVIACGFMKNPDILILDEPTSGLDGENMRTIADMMRRLADGGACILVISHDLELIHAACNCRLTLPITASGRS